MRSFEKLLRIICMLLFTIIIVFLAVHSLFFTSEIKSNETMRYLSDNVGVNLLVIGILLLLALWLKRIGWPLSERFEYHLVFIMMFLVTTLSILCVLISKSLPIFDQQLCISAANALISGNLDGSLKSYYLNYFPFQLPWIFSLSLLSWLGGAGNIMVFQFANVAANVISIWALAESSVLIFDDRKLRLLTWMGSLAFLPITFYVPFVYGNLLGLSFMLLGVRMLLLFLREHKARYLIGIVLLFTIASLLKKNFMIASVAAFLILIMDVLRSKRVITYIVAFLLVTASFVGNQVLARITYTVTGVDLAQGFPMSSFVMLGLQEEPGHEPGWYNNYGYMIYEQAGFNTAKADTMARQLIRQRLDVFSDDPAYTASFFYRKMISQWDEPSFQSLWVNEVARNPQRGVLATSLYEHGKAEKAVLWWMNLYHSVILVGVVLWLLFRVKPLNLEVLFFPLYFVGGYLFHLVWEAKGQYTMFYFFCIIPYAIMGYLAAVRRLNTSFHEKLLTCPRKR